MTTTPTHTVRRYDRLRLDRSRAHRNGAGSLVVPARLTRAGVFDYGSSREYRDAEDVHSDRFLADVATIPVTLEHPAEFVTADNARELTVGTVGDQVWVDGDAIAARLVIHRADAIEAIESGTHEEISLGYTCEVVDEQGTAPDGTPYTHRQIGHRHNHAALVPRGRAGRSVRVMLDSGESRPHDLAESRLDRGAQTPEERPMSDQRSTEIVSTEDNENAWVTITHRTDGVTESVKVRESAAALIRRLDADRAAAVEATEAAKADAEKLRGELDEARAKIAEAEKFDADAERAEIEKVVTARMRLDAEAKRVGVETTDEMSDHEIRCAAIARINSDANTSGMSEEMVRGMYLSEFGRWDRARAERDTVATDTIGGERTDNDDPYAALRA